MFIDSHCHLSAPDLISNVGDILQNMALAQVSKALCISTSLPDFEEVQKLVDLYPNLWASIGVHPEEHQESGPTKEQLLARTAHEKVVAVGETGLDYFQFQDCTYEQMQWQRDRFDTHLQVAKQAKLPVVIHTRGSAQDTLVMLKQAVNTSGGLTGVFHCFTESIDVAKKALDLGFYISFSGILTFKNAASLRDVAKALPHDACLIETDSPYLAPVPYRGKVNTPAYVPYVAQTLADLWQISVEEVAQQTTQNFKQLFQKVKL